MAKKSNDSTPIELLQVRTFREIPTVDQADNVMFWVGDCARPMCGFYARKDWVKFDGDKFSVGQPGDDSDYLDEGFYATFDDGSVDIQWRGPFELGVGEGMVAHWCQVRRTVEMDRKYDFS